MTLRGTPAVFLDRDDTLIVNQSITAGTAHPGDLFDPNLIQLLPGVAAGLAELCQRAFKLIVVTNQGGIARGTGTIAEAEACNRRVQELVIAESRGLARIDAVYFCPYHPRGIIEPYNCEHPWRKPAPGMFFAAAREHQLDLTRSWMIGDAERDLEAAVAAGVPAHHALRVGTADIAMTFQQACAVILAAR